MINLGKLHFRDIGKQERVIRVIHRHWFDIFKQFIIIFAGTAFLVWGFFSLPDLISDFLPKLENTNTYAIVFFIESTFALILWLYASLIWIDYHLDIWVITTERIINVEQKGVFVRQVSELKLSKIQDVTTKVGGVIPTILNYGNVYVQTAGQETRFVFRHIPDPYHTKSEIMKLQKQALQRSTQRLGEMVREGSMNM
ncbi:bacterial membrane flanked domain protein [bacterium BMS3Abin15]|nr:bacterial membrane flanked domain protein [bacterium BMS3Abin15]